MKKREKHLTLFIFLFPAVLLYAVFFVFPMAQAFYIALFSWRGVSMNKTYVGLENFSKLVGFHTEHGRLTPNDDVFWQSIGHNLTFMVVSLAVVIPLALFFSFVLSRRVRGAQFFRAVYLFPNIISIVAIAALWQFVYLPGHGLLDAVIGRLSGEAAANPWLGSASTALPAVIATNIWYSLGFYIVLLLAGVQSIPRSFYEAAEIDGAAAWQQFRHVTLPLLWEVLKLAVVYLIIHTLGVFSLVWVMTEGGPGSHTETLLTYLYRKAFRDSEFGYATAIGVVAFVLIFAISMASSRLMRRETVEL